jgi:methyl halide transferase
MASPTVTHAVDWDAMWRAGIKPGERFDIRDTHKILRRMIDEGKVPLGRALVPGCGRGYDIAALATKDRFVVGLDLSPQGVKEAGEYLAAQPQPSTTYELVCGDFFAFEHEGGAFDFVYDYTFLCALHPSARTAWAAKMAALIRPGGLLVTLQFPLRPYGDSHPRDAPPDYTRGPPFLLSQTLYRDLLLPVGFELTEEGEQDVPPEMSDPKRAGAEGVAVWRRRA